MYRMKGEDGDIKGAVVEARVERGRAPLAAAAVLDVLSAALAPAA